MTLHDDLQKQQLAVQAAKAAVEAARQPLLELAEAERRQEEAAAKLIEMQARWSAQEIQARHHWAELEAVAVEFNQLALQLEEKSEEIMRLLREHGGLFAQVVSGRHFINSISAFREVLPWIGIAQFWLRVVPLAQGRTEKLYDQTLALMEKYAEKEKK